MTYPAPDEPSQQRRVVVYGRANQGSVHYRPLRKGRPVSDPAPVPGPTSKVAKSANRRRFVLFVVALLAAIAFGTAFIGVVLASPAPMAHVPNAPAREVPEPEHHPLPPTGRGVPAEHAQPAAGKSGSPAGTTRHHQTGTTKHAAGVGGEAASPTGPAPSPTVYYQNCNKARRAGAAPLHPGDPGYSTRLDKDGNGIACDEKDKKDKG
ncbi:hypothetical protein GCM10022251_07280 [Phytohabitans flavus]|uniref:Excalibur calcium-binding domain-containing protein n=1 Tax=Phytohabitans flavus TaxID=1076124 RepID=A0A6F8Y1V6_9ACTN|nr:excalibur calcium-binding domain-containing protein [Phytohabitans flavus]BCB80094.1 hypothetical protein Pflav_065040 [Phytohabitans flavus]